MHTIAKNKIKEVKSKINILSEILPNDEASLAGKLPYSLPELFDGRIPSNYVDWVNTGIRIIEKIKQIEYDPSRHSCDKVEFDNRINNIVRCNQQILAIWSDTAFEAAHGQQKQEIESAMESLDILTNKITPIYRGYLSHPAGGGLRTNFSHFSHNNFPQEIKDINNYIYKNTKNQSNTYYIIKRFMDHIQYYTIQDLENFQRDTLSMCIADVSNQTSKLEDINAAHQKATDGHEHMLNSLKNSSQGNSLSH